MYGFMATASQNLLFQLQLTPYHLLQQLAPAKSKCNVLLKCYVSLCTQFWVVLAAAGGVEWWQIRCFSYCFNYRSLCLGKGSGGRGTSSLPWGWLGEDSQGTLCDPPLPRFWGLLLRKRKKKSDFPCEAEARAESVSPVPVLGSGCFTLRGMTGLFLQTSIG